MGEECLSLVWGDSNERRDGVEVELEDEGGKW